MTNNEDMPSISRDFLELLNFLKRNRGFDFTGYKPTGLVHRIEKRMATIKVNGYADYRDYLEVHPEEFTFLFNTILINVTSFFRDPAAWDYLENEVLPNIVANKSADEIIRIWSTGCASGEEACSTAILMAELMGEDQFRKRVKIYATDVDSEALDKARLAVYSEKDVEGVPPELLQKYFTRTGNAFSFHKELRRAIIFGRNDLIQDAPISRIDLLICRNTLMYFNAETQGKILARFHFAMNENAFLFLGRAEMLLTHTNTFSPVNLKMRIFSKVSKPDLRERLLGMANGGQEEGANHPLNMVRVRDAAFEAGTLPHVVVDNNNSVALANERARSLFGLRSNDLGRLFQDLELSYRPVELRSSIERAYAERAAILLKDVEWPSSNAESRFYDIRIQPLLDLVTNTHLGVSITFLDVTQPLQLQKQLEHTNQELETAFEELQSTNEELETTNEELQSTIEELETTNEELQSTNEELETMNEELQSTNEELQTINDELHQRTEELNQVNLFMESILASIRAGVVVLDHDLRIQVWNHKMEDLWGLRGEEVLGQNFFNLDIGLPVDQLMKPIRDCLAGKDGNHELELEAMNRRGRKVICRVACVPVISEDHGPQGVITTMEAEEIEKT